MEYQVVGIKDGVVVEDYGVMSVEKSELFCQQHAGRNGQDICPVDDRVVVGDAVKIDEDGIASLR